jgi:D-beta-D-heptose 7-phosphate kinase/D-beta-D-heptose 1-phosphate adenosyltransferase
MDIDSSKVVVVFGYFNPIHEGHVEYLRLVKEFAGENGLLYVIVCSDKQARNKMNFSFVPEKDRLAVVSGLRYVDRAILSIDDDDSVCKTIQMLCEDSFSNTPTHLVKGGDVGVGGCKEQTVCDLFNIHVVDVIEKTAPVSNWVLSQSVKEAYEELFADFNKVQIQPQTHTQPQSAKRSKVFH